MQRFDFLVEDGFRDADRTVRDGLSQTAASKQATGNKRQRLAQEQGITHRPVNLRQKRRVNGPFHIQNVNAYDSRLKNWMVPFHGVATRYLTHYLGWRRILERHKTLINPLILLKVALGLFDVQHLTQT
jgi:hypothetical protein